MGVIAKKSVAHTVSSSCLTNSLFIQSSSCITSTSTDDVAQTTDTCCCWSHGHDIVALAAVSSKRAVFYVQRSLLPWVGLGEHPVLVPISTHIFGSAHSCQNRVSSIPKNLYQVTLQNPRGEFCTAIGFMFDIGHTLYSHRIHVRYWAHSSFQFGTLSLGQKLIAASAGVTRLYRTLS